MATNTDLMTMLLFGLAGDTNAGAEFLEKKAQTESVNSTLLPVRGSDAPEWQALGVVFGPRVKDDNLFREATLPPGWRKQATSHSMHTDILDAAGNKRGSYFYKGAFWDRDAILYHPLTRYAIHEDYDANKIEEAKGILSHTYQAFDRVTERILFRATLKGPNGPRSTWTREHYEADDATRKDCVALVREWLDEKFPDWQNPAQHWPDWARGWSWVEEQLAGLGVEKRVEGILEMTKHLSTAAELFALADIARMTQHIAEAKVVLKALRVRFLESNEAQEGTYDLALMVLAEGNEDEAFSWMEKYVEELPYGSFIEKAVGFLMNTSVKRGNTHDAKAYAHQYLERFKFGGFFSTAKDIIDPPKPPPPPLYEGYGVIQRIDEQGRRFWVDRDGYVYPRKGRKKPSQY